MRWLLRADVALDQTTLIVRDDIDFERNAEAVRHSFETRRPFGAELSAVGIDSTAVYCPLYVPTSDLDAQYRMVSGLKLSVRHQLLNVTLVGVSTWQRYAAAQHEGQVALLDDSFPS